MHSAQPLPLHCRCEPYVAGTRYMFIENLPRQQPAGEPIGTCRRDRSADGKAALARAAVGPSALVRDRSPPAADLLFTGKETGEFIAIDADTGKTLWQFQTGSGINAQPITFTHNGQQYVTVLSGIGGLYWNQAREALKNVPQGGSVWTFALLD